MITTKGKACALAFGLHLGAVRAEDAPSRRGRPRLLARTPLQDVAGDGHGDGSLSQPMGAAW